MAVPPEQAGFGAISRSECREVASTEVFQRNTPAAGIGHALLCHSEDPIQFVGKPAGKSLIDDHGHARGDQSYRHTADNGEEPSSISQRNATSEGRFHKPPREPSQGGRGCQKEGGVER